MRLAMANEVTNAILTMIVFISGLHVARMHPVNVRSEPIARA
jgi:hypothetical protein